MYAFIICSHNYSNHHLILLCKTAVNVLFVVDNMLLALIKNQIIVSLSKLVSFVEIFLCMDEIMDRTLTDKVVNCQ